MIKTTVSTIKIIRDVLVRYTEIPLPIETAWSIMVLLDKLDDTVKVVESDIASIANSFRDENGELQEDKKDEMTQKIREYLELGVQYDIEQLNVSDLKGVFITVRDLKTLECLFLK
jgi:hypothetical protein